MAERGHTEPCRKRIRAFRDGIPVVDTANALYVWEKPAYPTYFFPIDDVRLDLLEPDETVPDAAGTHVSLVWAAMDAWFEEDQEVYVHARSPYTRVDVLPTSRRARVELAGVVLADSAHPHVLFETGLRPRWYFPKTDVRMDVLEPSETVTHCPYKGRAEYWSARIDRRTELDVAWSYRYPLPESRLIAGLVCFYDERVELTVTAS